jgi:protein-S-isoprenylcysteine O-methyltransferase Ste14
MERFIAFGILSIPVVLLSWRSLSDFKSHGFYRFFSWECILWLVVSNYTFWFDNPTSIRQIFSWLFLVFSAYLVIAGVLKLKKAGNPSNARDEKILFQFEKTSELVETGIYSYIRHPLYSSLIFLTWGIFMKNPALQLFLVSLLSSVCLYLTAISDEKECIVYFGLRYREYMKRTKKFIPFIF